MNISYIPRHYPSIDNRCHVVQVEYTNIKLPTTPYVEKVDLLVANRLYNSRTDVIKDALREFFQKYPETRITVEGV